MKTEHKLSLYISRPASLSSGTEVDLLGITGYEIMFQKSVTVEIISANLHISETLAWSRFESVPNLTQLGREFN